MNRNRYCALIVAAGKGLRMKTETPKQLLMYKGRSVLESAIIPFLGNENIEQVVIAVPEGTDLENSPYGDILRRLEHLYEKKISLVHGGDERSKSVYNGLCLLHELYDGIGISDEDVYVLIHDGARPNINDDIIERNIAALKQKDAVCTAVSTIDSMRIKSLNSQSDYPIIMTKQIDRSDLFNVQTPQSFKLSVVKGAYESAERIGYSGTDDASIVEYSGVDIAIVKGSYSNTKITTEADIPISVRVGMGYDVHRFAEGRKLILCGVEIPSELGLEGHSDADVATHALMDAILGATAKGDIGQHFPDTEEKYRGANSIELLKEVKALIEGAHVVNIDVTIIAQQPKLAPYVEDMRRKLAFALEMDVNAVNVKATTTEGLGFTGRREGIAAMATCSIEGRF